MVEDRKMDTRQLLAGTAIATALLMGGVLPAVASVISSVVNEGGGQVNIKIQDYENFTTSTLQPGVTQNYGVFLVTSINAAGGTSLWSSGTDGQFLVGVFNGITVESTNAVAPGTVITQNAGGTFDLYQVTSLPNFTFTSPLTNGYTTAGCAVGSLCYQGITTAGSPVLTLDLVPGADVADTSSTLQAIVTGTTVPVTGSASGFGDITGGSDAPQFVAGGFPTAAAQPADVEFADRFCIPPWRPQAFWSTWPDRFPAL